MSEPQRHLVIIIPALNEAATIGDVIREIPRTIDGCRLVEVMVIDDGSSDATSKVAEQSGADLVVRHPVNKGLARTFQAGIDAALEHGADIIVNTDADNHYDQSRIPDLIRPILEQRADIVIGGRAVATLTGMPRTNKYGNLFGSRIVSWLARLPKTVDVSSGFRAYSRQAAMHINVFTRHTYTHETLIQAVSQGLTVTEVEIPARPVSRHSRLISSIPRHIAKSLVAIAQILVYYHPLRFFGGLGMFFFIVGLGLDAWLGIHFLRTHAVTPYKYIGFTGAFLNLIGLSLIILAFLADMSNRSRVTQERMLYLSKRHLYDPPARST